MNSSSLKDVGLLIVRLAFGARLIYGTQDNVFSWERMIEFADFLELNGFPLPVVSAVVSVALQFCAGISWIIGYRVRLFAGLMVLNFIVALVMVHLGNDPYLALAPALHLLVVSFLLFTNGAGKIAIDKN